MNISYLDTTKYLQNDPEVKEALRYTIKHLDNCKFSSEGYGGGADCKDGFEAMFFGNYEKVRITISLDAEFIGENLSDFEMADSVEFIFTKNQFYKRKEEYNQLTLF